MFEFLFFFVFVFVFCSFCCFRLPTAVNPHTHFNKSGDPKTRVRQESSEISKNLKA